MKVVLLERVDNLGAIGDVVTVKDGFARNFLLPRGLATPWTKGGQRQLDQRWPRATVIARVVTHP